MKKASILLATAFFLFSSIASSQAVRFGVTAGMTLSSFRTKYESVSYNGKYKTGFTAGALANIPMSKQFSFQPALNFVQKGFKDESKSQGFTYEGKMTLNYLELPFNFLFNTRCGQGKFFIGAGPSVSMAVSGKISSESNGEKSSEKVKFGNSDEDHMRGMDFGANLLAGFETKGGFLISANYYQGLSNLSSGGSENGKAHNNYFGLKLGYMFAGKAKKS